MNELLHPGSVAQPAETALHDSEAFLRSVLDGNTDCLKVLDPQGRIEFMNANGRCLMEIEDFDSIKGKDWAQLWPRTLGRRSRKRRQRHSPARLPVLKHFARRQRVPRDGGTSPSLL